MGNFFTGNMRKACGNVVKISSIVHSNRPTLVRQLLEPHAKLVGGGECFSLTLIDYSMRDQ